LRLVDFSEARSARHRFQTLFAFFINFKLIVTTNNGITTTVLLKEGRRYIGKQIPIERMTMFLAVLFLTMCTVGIAIDRETLNKYREVKGLKEIVDHYEQSLDTAQPTINEVSRCYQSNVLKFSRDKRKNNGKFVHNVNEPALLLQDVIDSSDITNIKILSDCVRSTSPDHFEDRAFDSNGYGGGNNVTFLHGYFQHILPELLNHIIDNIVITAAETAGWRPYPGHLGIRCIEKLDYYTGGELLLHTDNESVYTLVLLLVDHNDFTGGSFYIKNKKDNDNTIKFNPEYGGGIMFDSESDHGVDRIITGERIVLAIELWPWVDSTIYDFRPSTFSSHILPIIPSLTVVKPVNDLVDKDETSRAAIYDDEVESSMARFEQKKLNLERRENIKKKILHKEQLVEDLAISEQDERNWFNLGNYNTITVFLVGVGFGIIIHVVGRSLLNLYVSQISAKKRQ